MSEGANSKQLRTKSGFPSAKKQTSIGDGISDSRAEATKCVATAGESFRSATIDLVADPADSYRLNLLLWDESRATVRPQIKYGRTVYEPIDLEPTIVNFVQWPLRPVEYGSTRDLFEKVRGLITRHVEISETSARLVTYFVWSTWFPDKLSFSPGVAILSPDDSAGVQLLRLLRCLCRRSMLLSETSKASLLSLPLQLSPTLLMNRPVLTRQLRNFLSTSNRRGLATVKSGKAMEICCPKAVYFGMDKISDDIASVMIRVSLFGATDKVSALGKGSLSEAAAEIQGKMLAYRLASYSRIRISHLRGMNFTHQTREMAMNLASCIVDDAELASEVVPLLSEQDDHVRGLPDRRLDAAILGAVLACFHEKKSDRVQVKEVTLLANTLLRTQGELVEYKPEEVGHRLDGFSLWRTRQKEGMFLVLSRDASRLVHRLALEYGVSWVQTSGAKCPDCQLLEGSVNSKAV
jgi:hypothetical protein